MNRNFKCFTIWWGQKDLKLFLHIIKSRLMKLHGKLSDISWIIFRWSLNRQQLTIIKLVKMQLNDWMFLKFNFKGLIQLQIVKFWVWISIDFFKAQFLGSGDKNEQNFIKSYFEFKFLTHYRNRTHQNKLARERKEFLLQAF